MVKQNLSFQLRRVSKLPLPTILARGILKIIGIVLAIVLLPVALVLHLRGYRRLTVFTDRIGHLVIEPDCVLKEQALGVIPSRKWILLAPPDRIANNHILSYWDPHFHVVRNAASCFLVSSISRFGLMRQDVSNYVLDTSSELGAYRIYRDWGDRPPILSLTAADEEWGLHMLKSLGLPDNTWFVCVHAREGGFSPIDEEWHSHRNSDIENTIPAIQEIIRHGGWVIRIGDPTMRPMPPMNCVIDYAHHTLKSDRLDVILCAKAKFLLGSTSGIALVSSVFGVPCAISNTIPLSNLWFGKQDITIPKLLWSSTLGRHLRFDEILGTDIANYNYATSYKNANLQVVENTSQDIRSLAVEMMGRLDKSFIEQPDDLLRSRQVRSYFKKSDMGYFSAANLGTLFLRSHPELLPPEN